MKALRANGVPWGTKFTILGGLRKERRPREKKVKVKQKRNICTSKELRILLGVNSEGEGVDTRQVVTDLKVKSLVADRVKTTRKRLVRRKVQKISQ